MKAKKEFISQFPTVPLVSEYYVYVNPDFEEVMLPTKDVILPPSTLNKCIGGVGARLASAKWTV